MRSTGARLVRRVLVAIGALGMALAGAAPAQDAWSALPHPAIATTSGRTAASDQAAVRFGWGTVVAGDEFSYQGGPDPLRWRVYDSPGHAGRGRRSPAAWHVNGRVATVTGDRLGTTGGMADREGRRFGRWEARMRTSVRDASYHPVLLLWRHVASANCPEVNFAEGTNNTKLAKFFLHYGCHNIGRTRATKAIDMTRWHNYAVQWTPTEMTGYIDGVPFFHDSNPQHLPQVPMHACLQLDWFPRATASPKTTMSIDWIRVYALPEPPTVSPPT
jgi:Glycosyl hydrolases family 16